MTAVSESTGLLKDHHQEGHHEDHHGNSSRHLYESVPLYAPPKQRQRWDDVQILPHVNWGDLYFDLFYVAAAFQLSHAFMDSPTKHGLLYFAAAYLPLFGTWNEKLVFFARFTFTDDNMYIRTMEILHLALLGTTIAFIQPFAIMHNTYHDLTMTIFTGAHTMDEIFTCIIYYDLTRNVVGGPEAKVTSYWTLVKKLTTLIFYGGAFCISFHDFYFVNGQDSESSGNYLPAYFMVLGFIWDFGVFTLMLHFFIYPLRGGSHKESTVPMNLEYVIHRIGEWVMLMLGESILSILTIHHTNDTFSTLSYHLSFVAGMLTITMFQYLFFRSQPGEAKDHAMRRSQVGGFTFIYSHIFYSASLIFVGCSYKLMLSPQHDLDQIEEEIREEYNEYFDINQRIALVYAASQAVSFLALDFMLTSHRGFQTNFKRFVVTNPSTGQKRVAAIPILVVCINLALVVATLCLSLVNDLTLLSVLGCLLVFCQVLLRTVGLKYFPITIAQMEKACHPEYGFIEDERPSHWPNTTEPQSIEATK